MVPSFKDGAALMYNLGSFFEVRTVVNGFYA